MTRCRDCGHEVSEQAMACPHCGAPFPARPRWDGWGFEYRSRATLLGLPLLHISFKYRPNRVPVVAKGIVSIGQFGCGVINISQFGIGVIDVSQFALGVYALAQFGVGYSLIAQFGLFLHEGHGQLIRNLFDLVGAVFG